MENPGPAAGHPRRVPGDVVVRVRRPPPPDEDAAGRAKLLISCAVALISVAGSAIIIHSAVESSTTTTTSVGGDLPGLACPLVAAFMLYLLGLSLALAALVADQFPRAARVGVAVARALQQYLFGLGR